MEMVRQYPGSETEGFYPLYLSPIAREAMIEYKNDLKSNKNELNEWIYTIYM